MKKKKICFIAQFPPPIHGLSKAVDTLFNSEASQVFEFEKINLSNNKVFLKTLFLIFKSEADLFYFTISQTQFGNLRDLIILKLLRMRNKSCLIHLHGGYFRKLVEKKLPKWQKKENYKALNKLRGAIVLSNSLRSIFKGMIDENKIYVVPNCVDDEFLISDKEFNEKVESIDNKKIKDVLYLSNFIESKGYRYVLELAKFEKEQCDMGKERKFHFNFAGDFFDKKEKSWFYNYINTYNLNDYITYHGVVKGKNKRELLQKCNIFILLTRYSREGQPISILEAMGNGMAVITTDLAGIPDIVKNNINGIIYKDNTEKKIKFIYEDICKLNMKEIILRNRNEVMTKYLEKIYVKNMYNIFSLLTNNSL